MASPLYLVSYDIADRKRWRRIFRLLRGYGEWLQLSVFECRLSDARHAALLRELERKIDAQADSVVVACIGRRHHRPVVRLGLAATKAAHETGPLIV